VVASHLIGANSQDILITEKDSLSGRRLTQALPDEANDKTEYDSGLSSFAIALPTNGVSVIWTVTLEISVLGYTSPGSMFKSETGSLIEATKSGLFAANLKEADSVIFANVTATQVPLGFTVVTRSPTSAPVQLLDDHELFDGIMPFLMYGGIGCGAVLIAVFIGWLFKRYHVKPKQQRRRKQIIVPVKSFEPFDIDAIPPQKVKHEVEEGDIYEDFYAISLPRMQGTGRNYEFSHEMKDDDEKHDGPGALFVRSRDYPV
jgi:hypothetical protein